jgi:hypothetical protein
MLSSKLVRLIEVHWDALSTRIVQEIRADVRLRSVGGLPESDLRERARDILQHLEHWLIASREHELERHFEGIGAERHAERIPLDEVVLAYLKIKSHAIEFVRSQGMGPSAVEIYAEQELEHTVGQFFDNAVYHLIRGYQQAQAGTHAAAVAPVAG